MNKKTSIIILGVIGSITGLCFMANYFLTEQPSKLVNVKDKVPDAMPDEMPHSSNAVTQTKEDDRKLSYNPQLSENQGEEGSTLPKVEVPKPESQAVQTHPAGDEFPLRLGSKGPRVERLQVWLMRNYGRTGIITGNFTEETEAELKKRLHKTQLDEGTYQRYRMGKHVHEQVFIR